MFNIMFFASLVLHFPPRMGIKGVSRPLGLTRDEMLSKHGVKLLLVFLQRGVDRC